MKKLTIILLLLLTTSCVSFRIGEPRVSIRTEGFEQQFYVFNTYDYNQIHFLWVNNPYYFYNYGYYVNGIYRPYYLHPYFTRYCTYRNIRPNHNYYLSRRTVNSRQRTISRRYNVTTRRQRTIQPQRRNTTIRRSNTTSRSRITNQRIKRRSQTRLPRRG
jgi:hypothetical protein